MTLAPLLNAAPAIQIHIFAAMAVILLGVIQFVAPKGTLPHRTVGWSWVALMLVMVVSSFFIHELRTWGQWSPIHLMSIGTLVPLPLAVVYARRHDVNVHRKIMLGLYFGGVLFAGVLTFMPGRIMHAVIFGS